MKRSTRMNQVILVLLIFTAAIPIAHAQSGKGMGGMGTPGMSGQAGTAVPAPAGSTDFVGLWRQALGRLALNGEQAGRLTDMLQRASTRLSDNWMTLQDQLKRESAAEGDAREALRKRIGLTDAERDLIVEEATTDLRDFLTAEQVDLVQTAAFHGVSRAHSEQAMPMTMGMGTGMQMQPMNGQEDLMMQLAAAALPLNEGFKGGSLEAILKDLGAR